MIVTSALIIWKALMCVTGSESPVVVVLSEIMEPGFKWVIEIIEMSHICSIFDRSLVIYFEGRDIPMVPRVIKVHKRENTGEIDILTKGSGFIDLKECQLWLHRHAVGLLPYVGWVTIIMTEKPIIKVNTFSVLTL
ncbi:hypothetical protein DY000_02010354 [Brassica cretica]|uniref:Signal peptidase complex catalytic subunit SEC11 n=1 Tax=Brassica cretica TaxID=69181 RepID=A0ABQ7C7N0_BRACR|nr:hypothetical protein DY000_02010354 [Brassica cretica]